MKAQLHNGLHDRQQKVGNVNSKNQNGNNPNDYCQAVQIQVLLVS